MNTFLLKVVLVLTLITINEPLKILPQLDLQHNTHSELNVQNCLVELNKLYDIENGKFVKGKGFLGDCKNENVFLGQRHGIILEAMCPN